MDYKVLVRKMNSKVFIQPDVPFDAWQSVNAFDDLQTGYYAVIFDVQNEKIEHSSYGVEVYYDIVGGFIEDENKTMLRLLTDKEVETIENIVSEYIIDAIRG